MGINPFAIPIGTSDPIDICRGLPLYPGLGPARVGVTGAARSEKLLDVSATILVTRLKIGAFYSWGVGICGPAIGFLSPNVDVLRENIGNQGRLTLTFNDGLVMEAGLFVGASIGFGLNLGLQVYLPKPWYKPWSFAWRDAFTVDFAFSVDILALLIEVILFLLSRSSQSSFAPDSQNRLRDTLPDLKKTFGMLDEAGSSSTVEPDLRAVPKLTLPFNLANYFAPFKAANDSLSKVNGEISVGPSLHLQFPVKFNFDKFTVVGGVDGAPSAVYDVVQYSGNRVTASGNTEFNPPAKPSRVTSHVRYDTSFALGVSMHFKVALAKFFSFETNSPSLDLTHLLTRTRESDRAVTLHSSVSTAVETGCVLTPNMTLIFNGSNGTNFVTGQKLNGTITLQEYSSSKDADVNLVIEPAVAGFPTKVTVPAGAQRASFDFVFQNQCLPTGNRNNPTQTAPPSPPSPVLTYTVRATLPSVSNNPCSSYEVEVPLSITERLIRCQRNTGIVPGTAPPWDPLAGATINASPGLPSLPNASPINNVTLSLWFPFLAGEALAKVRMTFTLLNENRQPHSGSNVTIFSIPDLPPTTLKPSATGTLTLAKSYKGSSSLLVLAWNSKGPHTGYSNRFFLIVDAGCQYGQTEFWLDVWNWS